MDNLKRIHCMKVWGKPSKKIKVKTINLKKSFLDNKIKYCDLLKLDCEGSEYEILEGLDSKTFDKIGNILMEYHMGRENFLKEILTKNNFKVKIRRLSSKTGFIIASK